MYSKNFPDIRAGLVNYIGSSLESLELKTSENAKHIVVAMLVEEAINLSKDSDGNIDIKDAKPILRAIDYISKSRVSSLSNDIGPEMAHVVAKDYIKCSELITSILNGIGGKK